MRLEQIELVGHVRLLPRVLLDEVGQLVDGLPVVLVEHILRFQVILLGLGLALVLFLLELIGVDLKDELQHHFNELRRQIHKHV